MTKREAGAAEARTAITTADLLKVATLGAVLVWLVSSIGGAVDRAQRTETIDGFGAAGPIHLAPDGRVLLARESSTSETSDGRIEAFDPVTRKRATVLDGLIDPIAADMASDGTVCAVGRPSVTWPHAYLRCSSGLTVDFITGSPAGLPAFRPTFADVLSVASGGWVLTDVNRGAILHVDPVGRVVVLASLRPNLTLPGRPVGLARDGEGIIVATGAQGYVRVSSSDRGADIKPNTLVGGGTVVAVAPRSNGEPLVAIVERDQGFVAIPSTNGEVGPTHLTDDLSDLRGFVILSDGRLAVAAGTRLIIIRPSLPLR